uniref:Uncharacterized protein n=1 Tax=Chromera velia CCMP2878 TaxID=1169474 RepID=A0A0G4IDN0_9ALVE|eukprot:Cvel_13352.t1-p1 / transcript=Cvel_13352.t1 / gene=Cvel_13352 / organism=Chromera_velia_CCMP2878 / gene_product=hypothetical protein / transcript_product=hypothetical protein / location=Cvel_scaffold907:14042-14608(+) / protein_length=189 / sequence_SO=supercontig / SO=protein_coding / is_pseudo=false
METASQGPSVSDFLGGEAEAPGSQGGLMPSDSTKTTTTGGPSDRNIAQGSLPTLPESPPRGEAESHSGRYNDSGAVRCPPLSPRSVSIPEVLRNFPVEMSHAAELLLSTVVRDDARKVEEEKEEKERALAAQREAEAKTNELFAELEGIRQIAEREQELRREEQRQLENITRERDAAVTSRKPGANLQT